MKGHLPWFWARLSTGQAGLPGGAGEELQPDLGVDAGFVMRLAIDRAFGFS